MSETRYFVDAEGAYLGGFAGAEPPEGAVEVAAPPQDGRQVWDGEAWSGVPATPEDVVAERDRRLGLGFDYDFGDARGLHRIGTTPADRRGWQEVTDASNAAIALGQPQTPFTIVTDSGPAVVTALEWQQVLLAAAAHRQPIWAASFILQVMDPIPADYADDARWP